jgi:hypothetical protein
MFRVFIFAGVALFKHMIHDILYAERVATDNGIRMVPRVRAEPYHSYSSRHCALLFTGFATQDDTTKVLMWHFVK